MTGLGESGKSGGRAWPQLVLPLPTPYFPGRNRGLNTLVVATGGICFLKLKVLLLSFEDVLKVLPLFKISDFFWTKLGFPQVCRTICLGYPWPCFLDGSSHRLDHIVN